MGSENRCLLNRCPLKEGVRTGKPMYNGTLPEKKTVFLGGEFGYRQATKEILRLISLLPPFL